MQEIIRCRTSWSGNRHWETPTTTISAFFIGLRKVESVTEVDIQQPNFRWFLNETKSIIPRMAAYELSDIVIGIMNHEILIQHEINGIVCDAILMKLQDLAFKRMLYLDFVMRKTKSTNTFEAIHLAISELILNNIRQLFSGQNIHIPELPSVARYMSDHPEMFQSDFLEQFSNALLVFDEHRLTIRRITSIIKIFSRFDELDMQSQIALNKMVEQWIENNPTSSDVEVLFALISGSRKFDKLAFEESGLIRFTLNYLDENCDSEALPCYGHLIKMVF